MAYIDTYVYGLVPTYTAIKAIVSDDKLQTDTDGAMTALATSGSGNDITISVSGPDANILPTVVETITVVVSNGTSAETEKLTLTEKGINTGIFSVVSTTTDSASTGANNDGDLIGRIVTANPVNTSMVGADTVTYNVSDAAGNALIEVTRTVNVTFDLLPDDDADGILDSLDLDSDNNGEVGAFVDVNDDSALASLQLPGSDNKSIPGTRDSIAREGAESIDIGLSGVGEFTPGLLALLGVVAGLRRVKLLISSMLSILMFFMLQGEALAQQTKQLQQDKYQRHFYIGAGIGPSSLQPSTADSIYTLDNDTGTHLYIGSDLSSSWSVELGLSDLESLQLFPLAKPWPLLWPCIYARSFLILIG